MASPKNARLAAEVRAALAEVDGVRAVYLFGSAVTSNNPADVDLVVVYGPPLAPLTAPTVRPLIEAAVAAAFSLPAHVMFFTEAEVREPYSVARFTRVLLYGEDVARPRDVR